MSVLSYSQVYALARWAGCTDTEAIVATAISQAESAHDPQNIGDQTLAKYGSRGLWQIFTGAHNPAELGVGSGGWTPALVAKLEDPYVNAHSMWLVSNRGATWKPWSTFNDGAYSHYVAAAQSASHSVGDNWHAYLPGSATPAPSPVTHPIAASKDRLRLLGNANPRVLRGLAWMAHEHAINASGFVRMCLMDVREALGISVGAPTAIAAWNAAGKTHQHGWYSPPAGVPVFWGGGSGHVALSDGQGYVWSNDIVRAGHLDRVPIGEISRKWGKPYLGWADTLNGVSVYTLPGTATTKPLVPAPATVPVPAVTPAPAPVEPAPAVTPAPVLFPAAVSQAVADLQAEVAALQATLAALATQAGGAVV